MEKEVDRLRATLAYIEEAALRCDQPFRDERPSIPTGYRNIAAIARLALLDDARARGAVNGEWWASHDC